MQGDEYYKSLGLKCGIEIHRQLDTGKLFCRCSTNMEKEPSGEVVRKLRAVSGELGELDVAALHEAMRGREFAYRIYPGESCLVELDEEPPHEPDSAALEASLLVSLMLNAQIPDEIHFMRKTVVDGSNTSGFQRTAIVGLDGHMDVSFGRVGITNISLEEESAQILGREDDRRTVFGLNRLGIPLVEIGTSPDIKTPAQAREVAEKIGALLRSTERVKRGIGTIRQDINVSIAGGARVEIKGAQDLRMIPEIVAEEAERQKGLLALLKDAETRGIKNQAPEIFDATDFFSGTQSKIFSGKKVFAMKLSGFAGLFRRPLNKFRTFGREAANYARSKAGVHGIIHSDEDLAKYGVSKEFSLIREKCGAGEYDLVAAVSVSSGEEPKAHAALHAAAMRASMLISGVPKETRRALADGDSEYMRPLPGAARMYPETDILPISVTSRMISEIKKKMPEAREAKIARFAKLGLNHELAAQILDSDFLPVFERAAASSSIPARDIANVFLNVVPDLKSRENVDASGLPVERFLEIVSLIDAKKIGRDAVPLVLAAAVRSPEKSTEGIIKELGISMMSEDDARAIIRKIIREEKNKNPGYLIGKCVQALKGRIENKAVFEIVSSELKKLSGN